MTKRSFFPIFRGSPHQKVEQYCGYIYVSQFNSRPLFSSRNSMCLARCVREMWASRYGTLGTHTRARLTALFLGLPGWASTRKVKPIWILLKEETVSGSGISWAICRSAPCSRQITTPAPHRSVFTGRIPFLPPNQHRQSTEGTLVLWAVL